MKRVLLNIVFVQIKYKCAPNSHVVRNFQIISLVLYVTGYKLKKGRDYEELLNIAQALIVNVKSPRPGIWKLKVTADKQHTIRITGLSVMNFNHGFSRAPTLDMTVTEARPIKGRLTLKVLVATVDALGHF